MLLILVTTVLGVLLWGALALATTCANNPCNGTNGNDRLTGDGRANTISGLGGNDILDGGRGRDQLNGGRGVDVVYGRRGYDIIDGTERYRPTPYSYKVPYQVQGGRRTERLLGGSGNDTIRARDGKKDIIRGGPGRDTAYVDRIDTVAGVEVVRRGGGGGTTPTTGGGGGTTPTTGGSCPEGQYRDETGKCVPIPDCGGNEWDPQTHQCYDPDPRCPKGKELRFDAATEQEVCVRPDNTDPTPPCSAGEVKDPQTGKCGPPKEPPPTCPAGEVKDPQTGKCGPEGQSPDSGGTTTPP
jgi:hypothetical protein